VVHFPASEKSFDAILLSLHCVVDCARSVDSSISFVPADNYSWVETNLLVHKRRERLR